MLKFVKRQMKNEKGLTLVELLAVVVILGIIAAIAVPSIGGLINNSKKDAHISNAKMMVEATRMAVAADINNLSNGGDITMQQLVDNGYLEEMKNPTGETYTAGKVNVKKDVKGNLTYLVTELTGNGFTWKGAAIAPNNLKREHVELK